MARRNMLTCVYVSDDNKSYLKRQDSRYQGQLNGDTPPTPLFGSVPATLTQVETLPNSPDDLKPRRVLVRTTAGDFTGSIPRRPGLRSRGREVQPQDGRRLEPSVARLAPAGCEQLG
jgi:hypothetical protein